MERKRDVFSSSPWWTWRSRVVSFQRPWRPPPAQDGGISWLISTSCPKTWYSIQISPKNPIKIGRFANRSRFKKCTWTFFVLEFFGLFTKVGRFRSGLINSPESFLTKKGEEPSKIRWIFQLLCWFTGVYLWICTLWFKGFLQCVWWHCSCFKVMGFEAENAIDRNSTDIVCVPGLMSSSSWVVWTLQEISNRTHWTDP